MKVHKLTLMLLYCLYMVYNGLYIVVESMVFIDKGLLMNLEE